MSPQKTAGEHGTHSQQHHSSHLHNPTGYTDEAAQEEHEFLDRVEHEAQAGQPQSSNQRVSNTSLLRAPAVSPRARRVGI